MKTTILHIFVKIISDDVQQIHVTGSSIKNDNHHHNEAKSDARVQYLGTELGRDAVNHPKVSELYFQAAADKNPAYSNTNIEYSLIPNEISNLTDGHVSIPMLYSPRFFCES